MAQMGKKTNRMVSDAVGEDAEYLKPEKGKSKEYRKIWDCVVMDFDPLHFRESDRPVLDAFCEVVLKLEAVREECKTTPYTEIDEKGKTKIAAVHDLEHKLANQATAMAKTLKIVPSARMQKTQNTGESQWAKRRKSQTKEQKVSSIGLKHA